MKTFEASIKIYTKAIYEENVQNWLNDFVIPDLVARWSDGTMTIKSDIKEMVSK